METAGHRAGELTILAARYLRMMAAFIAVLISRLNRIVERTIVLNGISDDDTVKSRLKADLPRLMHGRVRSALGPDCVKTTLNDMILL
jgi:hypothetical protein